MGNFTEEMSFSWEFTSPMEVEVSESSIGVALVKGTLLAEGISRNGNLYTLNEMEKIAKSAEGKEIYFGTMRKEVNGIESDNAHANIQPHLVGKIMQTWIDPVLRKIKFIAQIVSSKMFPNIVEEVKQGWGVSIGGKGKARYMLDSIGRIVTKIFDLTVNHVQLLRPSIIRGQDAAQVEEVTRDIQESMLLKDLPEPKLSISNIEMTSGTSIEFSVDI